MIVQAKVTDEVDPSRSVTAATTSNVPSLVCEPLTVPLSWAVSPCGRPVIDHVKGRSGSSAGRRSSTLSVTRCCCGPGLSMTGGATIDHRKVVWSEYPPGSVTLILVTLRLSSTGVPVMRPSSLMVRP